MPPVKSSVFEHFLKLSKRKDGNCRAAKNNDMLHAHYSFIVDFCRYVELERELELNDFERNWNY